MKYAPETPEDTIDDRLCETCQMWSYPESGRYSDLLRCVGGSCKNRGYNPKDGMIDRLEERLKRTAKEVDARDETEIS